MIRDILLLVLGKLRLKIMESVDEYLRHDIDKVKAIRMILIKYRHIDMAPVDVTTKEAWFFI